MLQSLPVQNCMHFIMPVSLADWKPFDVPGVVGVLRKNTAGQYEVVDAFDCEQIPGARDLAQHAMFGSWAQAAGSYEDIRFDVFLMPQANSGLRSDVVTLLQRSCGFKANATPAQLVSAA